MYVLADQWQDGYLDYHRPAGELRVAVESAWTLRRLDDVFLEQPRSLRRVWNYVREVGPREVWRKVRSRWAERVRDRRFLWVGTGRVVEADADSPLKPGTHVVFVAPSHPECVERVVLPPECLRPFRADVAARLRHEGTVRLFTCPPAALPDAWDAVAGWSRFAGYSIRRPAGELLDWATSALESLDPADARLLPLDPPGGTPIRERSADAAAGAATARSAVLFGLGNYAKTVVLPNLDRRLRVVCVHEIEPTQIGRATHPPPVYDTADVPREDEQYDVYLIAGYHHTHAPLAVHALRAGGWAVVEKPLVTTRAQLAALLGALEAHPGRLFAGFHMRYNPLYEQARHDLGLRPGEPVNSHCIVFEVPLVRRHWYNWPNARSRVVSNGCHWIDHFLFLNDFARPVRHDLWLARNGDVHISVELENGATLSLSLTDIGSRRIGVREHIELRRGEVTVRVTDGGRYEAEDRFRILRRMRINKMRSFRRMYATISRHIIEGRPGDSLESVRRTCELMLDLEDAWQHHARVLGVPRHPAAGGCEEPG